MAEIEWSTMDKVKKWNTIIKLVAMKKTASQIADRIPGATRNSVIGFCHRNNITLPGVVDRESGPKNCPPMAKQRKPRAPKKEKVPDPLLAALRKSEKKADTPRNEDPQVVPDEDLSELIPPPMEERKVSSSPVSILQLDSRTCRYPLFDTVVNRSPEQLMFCGDMAHETSLYCTYHAKLCLTPRVSPRMTETPKNVQRARRPFIRGLM